MTASDDVHAGTVKTSMDHPTQGNTQMFRRGLDDAGYQQVCVCSAHTEPAASTV